MATKILLIFLSAFHILIFSTPAWTAQQTPTNEYVYVLEVEGGSLYRISYQAKGDAMISQKVEVRRMEVIAPETVLEISEGVRVVLTCPGCRNVKLGAEKSPYRVKMEDFGKEEKTAGELLKHFTDALKHFVHPETDFGRSKRIDVRVRGDAQDFGTLDPSLHFWPLDGAQILGLRGHLTLEWPLKIGTFLVEVKESNSGKEVYSERISTNRIRIPNGTFKPGRKYNWSVLDEATGKRRSSSFILLSEDRKREVVKVLNEILSLLPPEAGEKAKSQLQAGYLFSEGLNYDAWQWMEGK